MVKPGCIPKTRNAATSVQTVLIGLTMSLPLSATSSAWAGLPMTFIRNATMPSSIATPSIFPPIRR
jgi:hypothetical protein